MKSGQPFRVAAIVTAAGSSARMGGSVSQPAVKKEYRMLPGYTDGDGRPLTVLGSAVSAFAEVPAVSKIIVTVPPGRDNAEDEARAALPEGLGGLPGIVFVRGGENRQTSVYRALRYLQVLQADGEHYDLVLIHDGARPWVSASLINAVIGAARVHGAAIPVVPVIETPKILDNAETGDGAISGFITRHPRRKCVVFAQTPQGFRFEPLMEAHEHAAKAERAAKNDEFTDDAEVWAFAWPQMKIAAVPGEAANKKITFPEDLPAHLPVSGVCLC
ncbi:MAG: 2-C-methyl-D-erythritol 4-phosphate cytidylyltransferase [Spirochaetaceae bacterium]|jgi:2-C-methyl-D-erythritol 4-phosphate cytidylyltransferase|nr:2-C-methyl-D-erythritol 4-phosphate cytidylyltransferase [Spirochaetaceae bacterium]